MRAELAAGVARIKRSTPTSSNRRLTWGDRSGSHLKLPASSAGKIDGSEQQVHASAVHELQRGEIDSHRAIAA